MAPQEPPENRIVPVSGLVDEDENTMQGFIRRNIVSILHPVGEHIRELQQQIQHMKKDVALIDADVRRNKDSLEQHDRDLLAAKAGATQTNARLDKLQTEFVKSNEDRRMLESDHEKTKTGLTNNDNRLQNLNATVRVLQQRNDDLDANVCSLKVNLSKAEKNLVCQGKSLSNLKDSHEDLLNRHSNTEAKLEETQNNSGSTNRDLLKHVKLFEHQREDDAVNIKRLNDFVANLQNMLDDANGGLSKQANEIKLVEAGVQQLRQVLDHENGASKKIETLQLKQCEMNRVLNKCDERLDAIENNVQEQLNTIDNDREYVHIQMQEQQEKINTTVFDIASLETAQQRYGKEISSIRDIVACTDKLQRDHKKLQEQADSTEQEVMKLSMIQKAATSSLENHTHKHKRAQEDLQQMTKEVDSTIQGLKGELGTVKSVLTKLGAHYDSCNQNIQGLSKGFQDAHRHIVNPDGGMLPRKPSRGMALPVIPPRTPRTAIM